MIIYRIRSKILIFVENVANIDIVRELKEKFDEYGLMDISESFCESYELALVIGAIKIGAKKETRH